MIGTFLSNLLGPNWRTSFIVLVSGIAALLGVLSQQGVHIPAWLVGTAGFIAAGGFAAIGFAGEDDVPETPVTPVSRTHASTERVRNHNGKNKRATPPTV